MLHDAAIFDWIWMLFSMQKVFYSWVGIVYYSWSQPSFRAFINSDLGVFAPPPPLLFGRAVQCLEPSLNLFWLWTLWLWYNRQGALILSKLLQAVYIHARVRFRVGYFVAVEKSTLKTQDPPDRSEYSIIHCHFLLYFVYYHSISSDTAVVLYALSILYALFFFFLSVCSTLCICWQRST